MTKNVLLTGASGFLGKHIYEFLLENYTIVETLGRHNSDNIKFDFQSNTPLNLKHYNLVVHSAGKAHVVPRNESEAEKFYKINLEGTETLLKALEANPPDSFVFISTIAVYGLDLGQEIDEDCPLNAVEPYGDSKVKAERAVINWCNQHNCKYGILRLPLVAGLNPPGNLGAMINGIRSGRYFRIGAGKAKKSMVLAEDVASIIPHLAAIGGVYNLTDGHHPSFKELETVLEKRLETKVKVFPFVAAKMLAYVGDAINFILRKRAFPLDSRAFGKITSTLTLNDTRARKQLGWRPKSTLEFIDKNIR